MPPVPHCGLVKVTAPIALPPVRAAVKVKIVWVVPEAGEALREAVMVGAVTVTDAVGDVDAPPCETVIEAVRVPAVKVHWKVLSVLLAQEPATSVPPAPHCGLVKVTAPVALPPVLVAEGVLSCS